MGYRTLHASFMPVCLKDKLSMRVVRPSLSRKRPIDWIGGRTIRGKVVATEGDLVYMQCLPMNQLVRNYRTATKIVFASFKASFISILT